MIPSNIPYIAPFFFDLPQLSRKHILKWAKLKGHFLNFWLNSLSNPGNAPINRNYNQTEDFGLYYQPLTELLRVLYKYRLTLKLMSTLIWKINRLRVMGIAEIAHRIKQVLQSNLEKTGYGLATNPPSPSIKIFNPHLQAFSTEFDHFQYLHAADQILSGVFKIFALSAADLGFPPLWNQDPLTGTTAPLTFGKTLNYRDEKLVGNIKYLWEPNRHLELVTLAQAWHLSGDPKYATGCRDLLESWFNQCPYPLGANWTSSLEHSVRLVNWSFAWQLLGGDANPLFKDEAGQAFRSRWLDMIYQHCHFIAGHFSKYSSANNHLLGEYMGLFIGSINWPLWQESEAWRNKAQQGFEAEALLQNTPDGVNREQATWYHHEVADMLLLCGLIGKANGIEFSLQYWQRLEAMLDFIAAVMDVNGNVPMIGDADDAVMVRFYPVPDFHPYRCLLATGAVIFERGDFKVKAAQFDDKSRWLLGDAGASSFNALLATKTKNQPCRAFKDGGYYLMGDAWESEQEIRLVADVGPLGYLSIAAHGHADALSFTLSLGGLEMLIDPGTYAYHTEKQWRDYFRGTSAHNTVRIDGIDQSVIGGNFMWIKHADAKLNVWDLDDSQERLVGSHDGYQRLADPVLHTREIVLNKLTRAIQVRDVLKCQSKHLVEIHWHCHEEADVTLEDSQVKIARGATSLNLSLTDPLFSVRLAKGEESPPLGWISRAFDYKAPTTTIVWTGEIEGNYVLESNLYLMV